MLKSKVLFSDRQARSDYNMLDKIEHIFNELGLKKAIKNGHKVMIKTHFGAWGNTNYIRPAYVRAVVDLVKKAGGHPFVAESCGLGYGSGGTYGGRTTAPEYLSMAALNGFTEASLDAPIIMADGYWGTDVYRAKVNGKYLKVVDVAAATLDADIVIVLTHAKGHGLSGLGGTIKNLGIGLVGKSGKAAMHFDGKVKIDPEKCLGPECSLCLKVCPVRCITMDEKAAIDEKACISCGHCRSVCTNDAKAKAITVGWRTPKDQAIRFVENALGVIDTVGRDRFYYFNLAIDISDKCDCWNVGAPLLVHDIGIFGSRDPLAVDQATLDAINKATPNPQSEAREVHEGDCMFAVAHQQKDPKTGELLDFAELQFAHAEKMGLGNRAYELVKLEKKIPKS
ncbi:DUF362 domain-containing protein [Candidatus Thorarchaeota archaeon]|nr:MAG: DUF362 domain-containing protein [Candidatus Thorarchaeota archaeon]